MSAEPSYAAIDFGASSGRVLTGTLGGGVRELTERARFANQPVRLPDGLHWNLLSLFDQAVAALRTAGPLRSIGIDTWGVDYGLLDDGGRLLGLPYHYRDGRSEAMVETAFSRLSREEQYASTGIQTLPFNTLFQLLADQAGPGLAAASRLAMIPDLLGLWLTGELVNERTNASTTGLLDATTGEWSRYLVGRLGLPGHLFESLVEPGTLVGTTLKHLELGRTPLHTVASHDTASAFAAAPVQDEHCAILSSGTWSLLGLELTQPVLTPEAAAADLTNERGVDGTTRLLKNVMGLWLEQECARTWKAGHEELFAAAAAIDPAAEPALFDPDLPAFIHPGDMPARIADACVALGQHSPRSRGEVVRGILFSLACKYRYVLDLLEHVSGREVHRIHVIGGGVQVGLLCQLTADVTGREVVAGPVEATAMGNILVQARATGDVASLSEMRAIAAASAHPVVYSPREPARGDDTYARVLQLTGLAQPVAATS